MDATTRALAVLATVLLVLAPMVNGVLAEAAKTADRLFLRNVDYEGELPDDLEGEPPEGEPPEGEPPDQPPPDQRDGEREGPGGGSCTVETETVAAWNHTDPNDDPGQAIASRANDAAREQQTFEITEEHIGLIALLSYENLRGSLSVIAYPEGNPDQDLFSHDTGQHLGDGDQWDSSHPRSQLTPGTWVAEIEFRQAAYDTLEFVVVLGHCAQEDAS